MSVFKNGSVWLKADFHLHTRADKEFKYDGDENDFVKIYVDQLKSEEIGIGVITNHNKFDKEEFNTLRKQAAKNYIYLLPGIEFSLKEGIHILIVFDDEWYKGHENNIQDFFSSNLKQLQQGQCFNSIGILEISKIALKELLINALVHRDYLKNAPIRLMIFDNRIEIISPGKLPNSLTVEDIIGLRR